MAGREVIGYLGADGTVTICARGLGVAEAAAAIERLDRLARAVKRAGHPGRLAHIRADLVVGLLDGRWQGLGEADIVADLLHAAETHPPEDTEAPEPDPPEPPDDPGPPDGSGPPDDPGPPEPEPSSEAGPVRPAAARPAAVRSAPVRPARPAPAREGVEIRVRLSTLLGLDGQPGEIPGLGAVLPEQARALVAAQYLGAEWRFAVTDTDGYLALGGVTRRRPRYPAETVIGRVRGGVVELQVPATLLADLPANPLLTGPWTGVIADIADQYTRRHETLAGLDAHPHDRFARAALARHIQLRDRCCTHPGCTRPARHRELDHTIDHHHGGPTTSDNTDPECKRHHRYKHELGWTLRQPHPGTFQWRSPLGQTYHTRGEPIIGPPEDEQPVPRPPPSRARRREPVTTRPSRPSRARRRVGRQPDPRSG